MGFGLGGWIGGPGGVVLGPFFFSFDCNCTIDDLMDGWMDAFLHVVSI